jgi:hypothetical protein
MWKNLFLNDLSGLETSLPHLGHLASYINPSSSVLYRTMKEYQLLEDMLAQLDTTLSKPHSGMALMSLVLWYSGIAFQCLRV